MEISAKKEFVDIGKMILHGKAKKMRTAKTILKNIIKLKESHHLILYPIIQH